MIKSQIQFLKYGIFSKLLKKVRFHFFPDRKYMVEEILPCLASANFSKVLFVGCEFYTSHYRKWFASTQTEYWTTDNNPEAAVWGETGRHIVCDVQELNLHFPVQSFDVVLLNGVFGFGVNDQPAMNRTIAAIHRVLKPKGILMIGWNEVLVSDPCDLENI